LQRKPTMAFQVSPGVAVKEIDLTNVVPAVSTSIGGIAGAFNWGPVEQITTVGSEKELASIFGTPDNNTFSYFLTAASFLKYAGALKVVRVASGHTNSTSGGTGVLIKNADHYDEVTKTSLGEWASKYPGVLGNGLEVQVCSANQGAWAAFDHAGLFDNAPGTSEYAAELGSTNDEMHIVVIDASGVWTGTPGTVLEKFSAVSQASDARKSDGTTNYYVDVINGSSAYIWFLDHNPILSNSGEDASEGITFTTVGTIQGEGVNLTGGTDDNAPTTGEIYTGFELFADAETVDVNLLISGPIPASPEGVSLSNNLVALAEARKDVVVFLSPPISATVGTQTPVTDVMDHVNQLTSTSYAVMDSTALKVYDKYKDVFRWIPACGHTAGLCAKTDQTNDAWWSPAGYTRGQLLGVTKVALNPKKADRDTLYKGRVNPIVSFPGEGTILFGDKTMLAKPSAFDRINVRRLFIVLEKAIATAAKYQLFEFNDEFTRAMFKNMVEPFMRDVKGRRGVTDFLVVCDSTNNTGEVVDRNEFVADIYIKPARSINFISLNFIATRTGVDFAEIVGRTGA
jgi:phage tail sheath protein FI